MCAASPAMRTACTRFLGWWSSPSRWPCCWRWMARSQRGCRSSIPQVLEGCKRPSARSFTMTSRISSPISFQRRTFLASAASVAAAVAAPALTHAAGPAVQAGTLPPLGRRAHAGVSIRAHHQQRRGGHAPPWREAPRGAGQPLRHLEGLQQPVLARGLPHRCAGPHSLQALWRRRIRAHRGRDPRAARGAELGFLAPPFTHFYPVISLPALHSPLQDSCTMPYPRLQFALVTLAAAAAALCMAATSHAQAPQLPPPDATHTATLQLMQGFPPPPDKVVRLANTLKYPNVRWAAHHLRGRGPTAAVGRGAGAPSALPTAARALDDALPVPDGKGGTTPLADWQKATYTDGLLVLHRGRVVYDRHHIGMQPHQPHVLWSMSKSLTGLLATELIQEGVIDPKALIPRYLPELATSAWPDATVQQTLDMTTSVQYAENFADPASGVFQYLAAAGLQPAPPGSNAAKSMAEFLPTLKKEGEHGTAFAYKSVDTEVLGWLLQRVTGKSYATLLSERIWSRLGAQEDAYVFADANGGQSTSVGVNATLRDLGRFGEMLRANGSFNGQQIISAATIAE